MFWLLQTRVAATVSGAKASEASWFTCTTTSTRSEAGPLLFRSETVVHVHFLGGDHDAPTASVRVLHFRRRVLPSGAHGGKSSRE